MPDAERVEDGDRSCSRLIQGEIDSIDRDAEPLCLLPELLGAGAAAR